MSRPNNPKADAERIKALEAKISTARNGLQALSDRVDLARADAADNVPGSQNRLVEAERELDRVQTAISSEEGLLRGLRGKFKTIQAEFEAQEQAEAWAKGRILAQKRDAMGVKVEALAGDLIRAQAELVELGKQLHAVVPAKEALLHASLLNPYHVSKDFILLLQKLGLEGFRETWPWGPHSIPVFSERIKEGSAWALKFMPRSEATSEESKGKAV